MSYLSLDFLLGIGMTFTRLLDPENKYALVLDDKEGLCIDPFEE